MKWLFFSLFLQFFTIGFVMSDDCTKTIMDFTSDHQKTDWRNIDDGVMGGISQSTFTILPDHMAKFSGEVSLANNGGFASVRTGLDRIDLSACTGFKIRIKGDGKTYSFRVRQDRNFDGVAFQIKFNTLKNEWLEIDLPFDRFEATYRGRMLPDADPLEPNQIRQIGFLISDKQAGPFELLIDWVKTITGEQ